MTLEDPFFMVKEEVFKALNKTRGLYLRWLELSSTPASNACGAPPSAPADADWTCTELRNALRSIEWDLEDLDDTIGIVEKNPSKFKIDNKELTNRKNFIEATRLEVKDMKDKMNSNRSRERDRTSRQALMEGSTSVPPRHSTTKYFKLENQLDSPSRYDDRFFNENSAAQQRMLDSQDEQLNVINHSIGSLKSVSRQIGIELDEQTVMLDDFNSELENTDSKLDTTMKKVAKVFHMSNDRRQWIAIGVLSVILVVVLILFIVM
ncbi:syntaxin 6 [Arctopsyche grandis]|uniref:syntaxin 6 n=1 Tax=Arctopsyche grandis TaxID=121162 RepID=UPI00406D8C8B